MNRSGVGRNLELPVTLAVMTAELGEQGLEMELGPNMPGGSPAQEPVLLFRVHLGHTLQIKGDGFAKRFAHRRERAALDRDIEIDADRPPPPILGFGHAPRDAIEGHLSLFP